MLKATSQTIDAAYRAKSSAAKSWRFKLIGGNTGEDTIQDPLLETQEAALERAKSEFIKNGHRQREVSFRTFRTDMAQNSVISVRGLPYIVKTQSIAGDKVKVVSTITAVRYE